MPFASPFMTYDCWPPLPLPITGHGGLALAQALAGAFHHSCNRCSPAPLVRFRTRSRAALEPLAFESFLPRLVARSVLRGTLQPELVRQRLPSVSHRYAVYGTDREAELATAALGCDHRVHDVRRTDDRIDGARLDAHGAADAGGLVYLGHGGGLVNALEWLHRKSRQLRERALRVLTTGRATVDVGVPCSYRFCVGTAARVSALAALRLRQDGVDPINE